MREEYCASSETVTTCPVCGRLFLEGPGATRQQKAVRRLRGLKNYKNIWKHIVGTHSGIPAPIKWKEWDDARQVKWIVETAKQWLEDEGLEF